MKVYRLLTSILAVQMGLAAQFAQAAEEIRVGFPKVFSETGQHSQRFDAAVARELCKSIGKPCQLVEFEAMFGTDELFAKRVDVLVSHTDSIAPQGEVAASKEYARMPLAFVLRKDSGIGEISPENLKGKTVTASDMEGYSFISTRLPQSTISTKGNFVDSLATGKVDLAVSKLDEALYELNSSFTAGGCCQVAQVLTDDTSLNSGSSRMLVRKSDKALKKLVDNTIDEMERDGRIKAAGIAVFGFDVSPNAKAESAHFPSAPEASREIEPAVAERMVRIETEPRMCSGVLLTGFAVVSAAHCFTNKKGVMDVKAGKITLYQGERKFPAKVKRIVVHPDYHALGLDSFGWSDIAILLLDDGGPTLPPLSFLTGREPFLSPDMMQFLYFDAAQYGYGNPGENDRRLLKSRARLRLIAAPPSDLLAGNIEPIDVKSGQLCRGDSGGGIFFAPGGFVSTDAPPLLLGVASTATIGKMKCGTSGAIMRTDAYADWIAATLARHDAD